MPNHAEAEKISHAVKRLTDFATLRRQNPGMVWGLPSSIDGFNRITGGYHQGKLTVLGMRTGEGKSSLTMQEVFFLADWLRRREQETGEAAGIIRVFTPEMDTDEILARIASSRLQINTNDVNRGFISDDEYHRWCDELQRLRQYDDIIKFRAGNPVEITDIESALDSDKAEGTQVNLVVVDYIQIINAGNRIQRDKVTYVAATLRKLALAHKVPILVASNCQRPKRDFYKGQEVSSLERAPEIDELSESSDIEKSANVVVLGHNPLIHDAAYQGSTIAVEFSVKKNRGGDHGDYRVLFKPQYQQWWDVPEEEF